MQIYLFNNRAPMAKLASQKLSFASKLTRENYVLQRFLLRTFEFCFKL